MRLFTILASFAASSVAAMVIVVLFGWIDSGSLGFEQIGYVAPLLAGGAVMGAVFSLPIALPTIIYTELTRSSSIWFFVIAGIATAMVMVGMVSDYTAAEILSFPPYIVRDLIMIFAVSLTASCTYWLFAWKLFPPKPPKASDDVVSE